MTTARQPHRSLRRLLIEGHGRPLAALLLALLLVLQLGTQLPPAWGAHMPTRLSAGLNTIGAPLVAVRYWLFDSYQKVLPRHARSQPVTVVAIDEKSLKQLGQWPWPRDHLADLLYTIARYQPAVVGLDTYMPEADQTSPDRVADRLPPYLQDLAGRLRALPSNDVRLAQALHQVPSVLGAAGFDFKAYTTTEGMRSAPMQITGGDPVPYVRQYPQVLASLPQLQAASWGQALLSVNSESGGVHRVALVSAVGKVLVPGLPMELFRIATGSDAISVAADQHGVRSVQVADLDVPTQSNGDIYLHYAHLADGLGRYVSAIDVLQGQTDASMFKGKLVLIGLTGSGLNDMRYTPLQEMVPGIEIQAQTVEALFDRDFLLRPWWFRWLELAVTLVLGATLLWYVPRTDNGLARAIRLSPPRAILAIGLLAVVTYGGGLALFGFGGWLIDTSPVVIGTLAVLASLVGSSMLASLADARVKLTGLVASGLALGRLRERDTLLHTTLHSACETAYCEGAAVLLKSEQQSLRYTLHTYSIPVPDDTTLPETTWLAQVLTSGKSLFINDLNTEMGETPANTRAWLSAAGINAVSVLAVPMKPHEQETSGVMLLFNARDPYSKVQIPFAPQVLPFAEALAAQAAVAIENLDLVQAQQDLMDALIKLIAGAIDAKSPYTGGHCERVPELAMMLAEAATEQTEGALADFRFATEEQWREFRVGAWLHDCGKVTTPEYVVDKSVKLETIYNRIHEVRTRFEVLLRDARIEALEALAGGADAATIQARYDARHAQLVDDFAFVAECNLGGEFMAPERIDRLQHIAAQTWARHFDDRLGLAHDELRRYTTPPEPLPATEKLLDNKPQHIIPRVDTRSLDPKWGFKVNVPQHLYHHGELHNLSIGRGTLTDEERFKINEHIIQTIVMLEALPLPKSLKRVPEYAGTHHETLTGDGYPRRLTDTELSVPARIMAIADIFEALTASDRPYKKGKTLSESVNILHQFKQRRHIDPVLFDLFLTSGVFLRYAERYMHAEQIDAVDIGRYLG